MRFAIRWAALLLACAAVIWGVLHFPSHAAAEQSVTISLSLFDHIATLLEGLAAAGTACGALLAWITKSRREREIAVTVEINTAVKGEREDREHDVRGLKQQGQTMREAFEAFRNTAAQRQDTDNLYRLIEKMSDKTEAQHNALRDQITTMVGGITGRIDSIVERRLAPRAD